MPARHRTGELNGHSVSFWKGKSYIFHWKLQVEEERLKRVWWAGIVTMAGIGWDNGTDAPLRLPLAQTNTQAARRICLPECQQMSKSSLCGPIVLLMGPQCPAFLAKQPRGFPPREESSFIWTFVCISFAGIQNHLFVSSDRSSEHSVSVTFCTRFCSFSLSPTPQCHNGCS